MAMPAPSKQVERREAISNERADRIMHHCAQIHRELWDAEELDAFTRADLGVPVDEFKDTINRLRAPDSSEGGEV